MSSSEIQQLFGGFRTELDEHHDRRERLIKLSRDVTIQSKKIIFLLHRVLVENNTSSDVTPEKQAAEQAKQGLNKIRKDLFGKIGPEVVGAEFWRYQRQLSPGVQEYIEAASYAHYLEHGSLIRHEEMLKWLSDDQGNPYVQLPFDDFLLGLSDLTGELMRLAIASVGQVRSLRAKEVCTFVRECSSDFELFTPYLRDLVKKQRVTTQSLTKIEEAVYAVTVRSLEYGDSPEMIDAIVGSYIAGRGLVGHERFERDGLDEYT